MRTFLVKTPILLLLTINFLFAKGREIILDSLYIDQNELYLDFHISNLLDEKTVEGLQKGFTSQITHQIRLWKTTKLVSSIESELEYSVIVMYDNWDNKYAIITQDEKRLTSSLERLRRQSSKVSGISLARLDQLHEKSKYYLSIQTHFQPMSDESYGELRNWMSKKPDRQEESKTAKSRGRIFNVLLDLMGFGDSSFNYKSRDFIVRNNSQVLFVD